MATSFYRNNIPYISFVFNEKRIKRAYDKSKPEVDLKVKEIELELEKAKSGAPYNRVLLEGKLDGNGPINDTVTTKDIQTTDRVPAPEYFESYLKYSKHNHRPGTTKRYKAVVDHFLFFLCKEHICYLHQITPETIEKYKWFRRDTITTRNGDPVEKTRTNSPNLKKGARKKTINFELSALRTMFYVAKRWKKINENPVKEVKMLKVDDAALPRFLSKEEISLFLQNSGYHRPVFFTFLNTGMRLAELINLCHHDVDLKYNRIHIRSKHDWKPKTGTRYIPLNSGMVGLMKKIESNRGHDRYVFCDPKGRKLTHHLRRVFMRITEKCGFPEVSRIHCLRHTFASHLVMSGVDLPTISKLLGHSDIQTTMIYAHLAPDHIHSAVERLDFSRE